MTSFSFGLGHKYEENIEALLPSCHVFYESKCVTLFVLGFSNWDVSFFQVSSVVCHSLSFQVQYWLCHLLHRCSAPGGIVG